MGLAAAAFDRGRRLVLRDQARRQIEQPFREHASALGELLRVSHHRDVVLHALVRPAARRGDKRELRKHEAELSEEAQHLAGNHLDIVLTADDDEARNLVTNEDAVRDRDLVLDAVHSLGHLEIERRCGSPANRRRDDDCIRPMHESVVDAVELILCVHLRDRAGPSAGLRRLRVVTLAGAELEIVEPNEPRLGAEVSRRLARKAEQMVGAREARGGHIHDRRRDAGEAQRPGRALGLACERMRLVRRLGTPRRRRDVYEHAAALAFHRENRPPLLLQSTPTDTGTPLDLPTVPRPSEGIAVETAFAERPTNVVANIRYRTELSVLERNRNGGGLHLATLQRRSGELLGTADVDPVFSISHGVPPTLVLLLKAPRAP